MRKRIYGEWRVKLFHSGVVVVLFFWTEAAHAFSSELLPQSSSIRAVDFVSLFHEVDDFLRLLFVVASANKVDHVWHVTVEPLGASAFASLNVGPDG